MIEARTVGHEAARSFQLPFRGRTWRGAVGNWAGAGVGSSIDFQDHRPYVPGDDPRYVDWQAYARSEHYVMKLYREEVSPAVDLVLDRSPSMTFDEAKRARALQVFYFALESALAHGSPVRAWLSDARAELVPVERVRSGALALLHEGDGAGRAGNDLLDAVSFRPGSLRVVVSDCLFPGAPESVTRKLASERGRGVIFAPFAKSEASPGWHGRVELRDCETSERRVERFDEERLETYHRSYRRHFELWEASARRYGCAFARLPSELSLSEALRSRALPAEAVQPSP